MDQAVRTLFGDDAGAVYTIEPEAMVAEAVRRMNQCNIGALAVTEGAVLKGIFTERDVLRRVVDGHLSADDTPVWQVMTSKVVVIHPETTVGEAMALVDRHNCRHLPVVEGDRIVAMVSVRDLIGHLVEEHEHRIAELTRYIYGEFGT